MSTNPMEHAEPRQNEAGLAKDIRFANEHAAAIVSLDRPRALNALNNNMRSTLSAQLEPWAEDPIVYAVILRSVSPRAFCAGGDMRELTTLARQDRALARASLAFEYELDWQLDRYSKPIVSLIDGICMGSGVGLTAYNTHRVAGAGYHFAMPEVAIGFFPDVGATDFLANLPDEIGMYLALTGAGIDRSDAYHYGLVTHCIDAAHFPEIVAGLSEAEPVDPLLDALHRDPPASALAGKAGLIADIFSEASVAGILTALERITGAERDWCRETAALIRRQCPTSLAVAFEQMRRGRNLGLRQALILEYRIAVRLLERDDLYEGVRALLIDKDRTSRWSPARIEDVDPDEVARLFAPLADGELDLAERQHIPLAGP